MAKDYSLRNAHGIVMIGAWMVLASTGIIFARYGKKIRFGSKRNLLGESIWYQIHRLTAFLTTVLTLLAFFFVLAYAKGVWVASDEGLEFAHSVIGGIVVSCAVIQAWMALFRCHPDSPYRFIFNWLHRLTGGISFLLSIPALFTIVAHMEANRTSMIVIVSLWSAWIVLLVIVLESISYGARKSNAMDANGTYEIDISNTNQKYRQDQQQENKNDILPWNNKILALFVIHLLFSISLAIPLMYYVRK